MAVSVLSFKVTDIEGNSKNVPIHLPDTATVADILTLAASMAPHLQAITSGTVDGTATLSLAIDVSGAGVGDPAVANSRVGSGATLSFKNSADVAYSQYIPAIKDAFVSGGSVVTGASNALDTWISDILNGGGSADPSDLSGLDLATFAGGKQANRK